MILYFMKQDALEFMKANLDVLYPKYFSETTSAWIDEAYGSEAFEIFKEVPDFELCPLTYGSSGEIDFENIQIVYRALRNISESQASDERLWAGLCNKVFYQYIRKRWKYDTNDITDASKDVAAIISRFFFTGTSRGYYFRNTLSKCWWVGRLTYDENRPNDPFYYLKAIGSSDLNSKITEIFYNSSFTSNPEILRGLFEALSMYYERKIPFLVKEVLRPAFSYLNAIGGGILLDALDPEDITQILVQKINGILMGRGSAFISDIYEDEPEEVSTIEEDKEDSSNPSSNIEISLSNLPTENIVKQQEEHVYVDYGDTITIRVKETDAIMTRQIALDGNSIQYRLDRMLLGKSIGDNVFIGGKHYFVNQIKKYSSTEK